MYDPIIWYQSQRSTMDLWFASVDSTLPASWRSVMDESGGLAFYWNPEADVFQYEHPNLAPPPPPYPPDHYQILYEYKHTFPSSDCDYRPPDYPTSYMPEFPVAPSYTSPIFLPHPAPPSAMYSDSIDVSHIPHSYATSPNFHDPQIYSS
ncbi:leucine-rich repeat extensin-like protein 6 [Pyrus ussuriensis x Pyrus communis]|uniref:Leucine-rich repeat extensin-like protein 6 n=1 Tax=Pyrus ussuriensis x Pyrus communis TaxID=2448454 RepID=A0A5N5F2E6_9ROSA|nr:leucine-rich repeat extensin-like protein 6 [Pyrus ussuriensis x Pyrus communis]